MPFWLALISPSRRGRRLRRALARGPGVVRGAALAAAGFMTAGVAVTAQHRNIGLAALVVGALLTLVSTHLVLRLAAFRDRTRGSARDDKRGRDTLQDLDERLERRIEHLQDLQWELSENLARYRSLLDTQNDFILRRNADGALTYVNRAFARAFGVTADDAIGRPLPVQALETEGEGPLRTDADVRRRRYAQRIAMPHGERWIDWEEHLVAAADGRGFEVQAVGRDVTEARRQEAALQEARDQAEAANRAKSRFLAAMSHEIRTPMNGILGMAGLLADTRLDGEQTTYVRAVDQSARTLLALIDEILDFSKIEAGKLALHPTTFHLSGCIQDAVELLAPRAQEKGLEIAWSVAPELPRRVRGDVMRVRQILLNLLSNAVKFTDRGGIRVAVSGREAGPGEAAGALGLRLAVSDTGIGLSADEIKSLFSEFEQAEAAIRRQNGGTGLGLAISKRLARAMGGEIRVESAVGHGATFTVDLVLMRAPEEAEVEDAPVASALPSHVLLAFDAGIERSNIAELLRAATITVHECELSEAVRVIETSAAGGRPVDRLIVDAACAPAEAGRALSRLRELDGGQDCAGIVLVSVLSRASLAEFRAQGFEAYLVKPVRPASVLKQLATPARRRGQAGNREASTGRGGAPAAPLAAPRRVLLAEDNDINALLARRLIERSGGEVTLARNGHEAIAAIEATLAGTRPPFDIVLMDIFMPGIDGLEACRSIKALFDGARRASACGSAVACPPIVALTANAFAEDRQRYLDEGMDDYLSKPFDKADLERLLARWPASTVGPLARPAA